MVQIQIMNACYQWKQYVCDYVTQYWAYLNDGDHEHSDVKR